MGKQRRVAQSKAKYNKRKERKMKQLTLEKLNRLSQTSSGSAKDSFQILSTSPPQTPEPSSKASKGAPQAPEPKSKASKGAPQAREPELQSFERRTSNA